MNKNFGLSIPAGRYVVAVSGGVDSVVLLDVLSKNPDLELIVAHFDHGIRDDSHEDAELVGELAKKYNLPFEMRREELGTGTSEELARDRRYIFLREIMKKYDAKLITAHHSDDVIESIAINLSRGTGWRGLAVLDSDVIRPMTGFCKADNIKYAIENNLVWHEDSTNSSDEYLRNRFRRVLDDFDEDKKRELLALWAQQKFLKQQIDNEVLRFTADCTNYSRYFYIFIDSSVAIELLRNITDGLLTRPQLMRLLFAIKTALPGKTFIAGNGIEINFTSRNFTVKLIK